MTGDESTDISFGAETTNIPRTSFTTRPWKSCPISSTRSRWCGSSTTPPLTATLLSAASTHLAWPRGVWIIGLGSWENWDCTCTARARIGLFWVRYVGRQSPHPEPRKLLQTSEKQTFLHPRLIWITNFPSADIPSRRQELELTTELGTTRISLRVPRRWFRILQRLPQIVIQRWM